MQTRYDPQAIEKEAQQSWADHNAFEVKEDLTREKFYCLSMLPYPSGDLHMGHVRNYTIGDVIARYQHMKGRNVLQPMGWDAFGLPAENAAIKHELPPAEWTHKNIKKMRKQFQQLGYAYDWKREITTCEPNYYHWEQWLFTKLFEKGLVYKKSTLVNWDPVDQTVLANEQVVDGKGWRSGAVVERREIPQWFLKITDYAEELLDGLDQLDGWPDQVKTMQRNWIGRSTGVKIEFGIDRRKSTIDVFTTRPDTLMGVTYLAIAPEHPLSQKRAEKSPELAAFIKKCRKTKMSEAELATQTKEGMDTGYKALHPITKEKLPIWVTNFVLMEYGSGAVMSVPAHDQRDFEFAQAYDLPIEPVIKPNDDKDWDYTTAAFTESGILINSGKAFDGLDSEKAKEKITEYLIKHNCGQRNVHYRLRDWSISRQRYWGTPIPIIYCPQCDAVPVPEEDLPVVLPTDLVPTGHGSPLKSASQFYKTTCPKCGKAAKRETDTFDTFVESSWYYTRYCSYNQQNSMLDDRAKYWTPVDQYIGGIEHAVMHLLYARFMHKLLRDFGLINSDEPFKKLLTQGMVLKDGSKMSKSQGNVVAPQGLIKKYGADTVRLFIIFTAPPEQSLEWSDSGVEGAHRFLHKLWNFCYDMADSMKQCHANELPNCITFDDPELSKAHHQLHQVLRQANHDIERLQLNTVVSAAMKILNLISALDVKQADANLLIEQGIAILLRLLAPITPHITHHLWQALDFKGDILSAPWPKVNPRALQVSHVEIIVQINGKLRAKVSVAANAEEEQLKAEVLAHEQVKRHLADKSIKRFIVVPNRLVNIVV